jgi:hypothetical protein
VLPPPSRVQHPSGAPERPLHPRNPRHRHHPPPQTPLNPLGTSSQSQTMWPPAASPCLYQGSPPCSQPREPHSLCCEPVTYCAIRQPSRPRPVRHGRHARTVCSPPLSLGPSHWDNYISGRESLAGAAARAGADAGVLAAIPGWVSSLRHRRAAEKYWDEYRQGPGG